MIRTEPVGHLHTTLIINVCYILLLPLLVHINDWSTSPSKIVAKRRDPTRAKGSLEAKNLSPDIHGKGLCLVLKLHLNFGFMTPCDGLKRCKLTSSRSPITQSIGFWKKFLLYLRSGLAFLRSLKLINRTQIDSCSQKWYRGMYLFVQLRTKWILDIAIGPHFEGRKLQIKTNQVARSNVHRPNQLQFRLDMLHRRWLDWCKRLQTSGLVANPFFVDPECSAFYGGRSGCFNFQPWLR